jgi:hypothetical protein
MGRYYTRRMPAMPRPGLRWIAVIAAGLLVGLAALLVAGRLGQRPAMSQSRAVPLFDADLFVNVDFPDGWIFTGARDRFRLYNPATGGVDAYDLPLTRLDIELLDAGRDALEVLAARHIAALLDGDALDGSPTDSSATEPPQLLPLGDQLAVSISGTRTSGALDLEFYAIYRAFPDYGKVVAVYAQAPAGRLEAHAADARRIASTLTLEVLRGAVNPEVTAEVTAELTPEVTPEVTAELTPEITPEASRGASPVLRPPPPPPGVGGE